MSVSEATHISLLQTERVRIFDDDDRFFALLGNLVDKEESLAHSIIRRSWDVQNDNHQQ